MLQCFTTNQDPIATVSIYLAIRWTLQSWNYYLSATTIYNCFRKSTLLTTLITLSTPASSLDTAEVCNQVIQAGNIHDSMAISDFLNPEEEELDIQEAGQDKEDILQEILDEHLGLQSTQNDDDGEQSEQPVRTVQEAQQALQIMIEYTEDQDALQAEYLRALERLEAAIGAIRINSQTQSTLNGRIM
jgi:hypothetical protein